ncbi:MAG: helix-turn-helix domain-containing protein [Patescibacteria group bacterium]
MRNKVIDEQIKRMNLFKKEKELIKTLRIFNNKHRLAILVFLKEKGEKSVGQIADHLEVPFNTVSKNLLYLARVGVLSRRYDTPFILYKISTSLPKHESIIIRELI